MKVKFVTTQSFRKDSTKTDVTKLHCEKIVLGRDIFDRGCQTKISADPRKNLQGSLDVPPTIVHTQ